MLVFANAKINIGLHILNKRKDGFHNLESLFYPIPLYDIIEINLLKDKYKNYEFKNTGLPVNSETKDNLCVKAFILLKKEFKLPPVIIHLHKIIPFGAGLGGGSSDAAFTINAIDNLFNLGLSISDKMYFANKLGSDCAFFIKNKPSLVSGKGENIIPSKVNLSGYYLILIYPSILVKTGEAYKNLELKGHSNSISKIINKEIGKWKDELHNDFEKSVFKTFPELQEIKNKLYNMGAVYASMSGSGSSIFGIFNKKVLLKSEFPKSYFIRQTML